MSERCRNVSERLDNTVVWGLGKIDCEIIDKLIISDSLYTTHPIYTRDTLGADRVAGGEGFVGEKEGLFVRRVERGATTQPLHYAIYPVG